MCASLEVGCGEGRQGRSGKNEGMVVTDLSQVLHPCIIEHLHREGLLPLEWIIIQPNCFSSMLALI